MPAIQVSIPESRAHLYVALRKKAKENNSSISHVACEALDAFLSSGGKIRKKNTLLNQIIEHLENSGGATPQQISEALDKDANTIRATLGYMKNRGLVKPESGRKQKKWFVAEEVQND